MKKFLFILLIGSGVCAGSVQAKVQDYGNGNDRALTYSWLPWDSWGGGGMQQQINHLNRMVGHVRWQVSRYHGDRSVRRDFAQIRVQVDRVNSVFRQRDYDRRHLRREIENLHARLHELEVRLRVRQNDFYHWR